MKLLDYSKPGAGLSKQQVAEYENKPALFRYFDILIERYWKMFELNLLAILFSLGIITIPAVIISVTRINRKFIEWEPVFVFEDFLSGFKSAFLRGIGVFFFSIIPLAFLFLTSWGYYIQVEMGEEYSVFFFLIYGFSFLAYTCVQFFLFPQLADINLKLRTAYKNSFLFLFISPFRGLLILAMFSALAFLIYSFPITATFLPFLGLIVILNYTAVFITRKPIKDNITEPYYREHPEERPKSIFDEAAPADEINKDITAFDDNSHIEIEKDLKELENSTKKRNKKRNIIS